MLIRTVVVGFLETNCYLISEKETGDAVVVDPGGDPEKIFSAIRTKNLNIKYIILTHGHHDHIGALHELRDKFRVPILLHRVEADFMNVPQKERGPFSAGNGDIFLVLEEGDEIPVGGGKLKVLHTPGHTPGGACFLNGKVCVTGDTLFCDGVGRTDFEGGSADALMSSIRDKLLVLPDDTKIFPGHGPSSTIGRERRYF